MGVFRLYLKALMRPSDLTLLLLKDTCTESDKCRMTLECRQGFCLFNLVLIWFRIPTPL